jgi:hypothetical protein
MFDLNLNNQVKYLSSDVVPYFFAWMSTLLYSGNGGFFSAVVQKRSNGKMRTYNAVVTSVDMENNMATVWDRYAEDYRTVAFEGVKAVRTDKCDFYFTK